MIRHPGYFEADLVSHSGPVVKESFAWTFTLTDIATGWTECAPLLVREQTLVVSVLTEMRKQMSFPVLSFDTDNDSVFINETVRDYCTASDIAVTRCRPYRKNDQAWVEQKNGSVVRNLVGYRRFEGLTAAAALADLYAAMPSGDVNSFTHCIACPPQSVRLRSMASARSSGGIRPSRTCQNPVTASCPARP